MGRLDNITDFSAKDSKAFNESTKLFEEAGLESSRELRCFADNIYNRSGIVTQINPKTHNSKNFLDEDYQASRKMNENTSAIQELTENLMYGSTEEDLDMEITDGGVAEEVAEVFARHGITGDAVKDTFKKLETFYGKEPNTAVLAGEIDDEDSDDEDDDAADSEDEDLGPDADEFEDNVDDSSDDEEDEDSDEEIEESLEEKYNRASTLLRKTEATRNLKKRFMEDEEEDAGEDAEDEDDEEIEESRNRTAARIAEAKRRIAKRNALKEALLCGPTGSAKVSSRRGVRFAGAYSRALSEKTHTDDSFVIRVCGNDAGENYPRPGNPVEFETEEDARASALYRRLVDRYGEDKVEITNE